MKLYTSKILIAISGLVIISLLAFVYLKQPSFCFNFEHNMHFGENKELLNPVNDGIVLGLGKVIYYPVETGALHTALEKEGFTIDPLEKTGGDIYPASFFGPTTRSAVLGFQKEKGLEETGIVDNETADALTLLYGCPALPIVATSTSPTSTPAK